MKIENLKKKYDEFKQYCKDQDPNVDIDVNVGDYHVISESFKGNDFLVYITASEITLDEAIESVHEIYPDIDKDTIKSKFLEITDSATGSDKCTVTEEYIVMPYTYKGEQYYLTKTKDGYISISHAVIEAYNNDHPDMSYDEARDSFFSYVEYGIGILSILGKSPSLKFSLYPISIDNDNECYRKTLKGKMLNYDFYVFDELWNE